MLFGYFGFGFMYWLVVLAGLIVGLSLFSVVGRLLRHWAGPDWLSRSGAWLDHSAAGLLFLLLTAILITIPLLPLLFGH